MNEQLTKFIELCLADGVISDKEREVIFRKAKALGVDEDECEILIDSLMSKHSKSQTQHKLPKKKFSFFSSMLNEFKKNIDIDSIKSSSNKVKDDINKKFDKEKAEQKLKEIQEEQNKITLSNQTSKPKKTTTKRLTSEKKINIEKPLKTFIFKTMFKRSSPGRFGHSADYEQSNIEFKYYLDKIEINTITNRKFILGLPSGFRDVRNGFIPPFDKTVKSKIQYLIKDIKEINEFLDGFCIVFNDDEPTVFLHPKDNIGNSIDKEFISEIRNVFHILKNNSIKNYEQFSKLILSVNTRLKKELINYKTRKEEYILESTIYFEVLKNNQSKINAIDRDYVQKFVKLNNYLKEKSLNLSVIINKIIYNLENEPKESLIEREEEVNFFKGLVYSYNLMVNQSIVMLTSLIEGDTITFYETYEVFDKMNVFNTNWENEVNNKLSEINESLVDLNFSIRGLMNQMRDMEKNIVNSLQLINTSIGSLENSINKQLSETNSRLKYENLTNYYKKSTLPGVMDWFDGPK